jgi:hypothetical protein
LHSFDYVPINAGRMPAYNFSSSAAEPADIDYADLLHP